jgi:hypothetical protein
MADQRYLAALAVRMAAALDLPISVAKARVQAVAESAGGSLDPGGGRSLRKTQLRPPPSRPQ